MDCKDDTICSEDVRHTMDESERDCLGNSASETIPAQRIEDFKWQEDDKPALATKPIIDAKDMAQRKRRIMQMHTDVVEQLTGMPHILAKQEKSSAVTRGLGGLSIFSPKLFVLPEVITDEEAEAYQITEEDMESLSTLASLDREMSLNQDVAKMPVLLHLNDVLAR
ncbi:unnamed protein product [Protopolystoma xenopodis]|uniref:Uncharacterized protein n=1 Tax=Protopolystoma xenopodis TaxID=117903 RepID=A0A448XCW5_9PLAT|nr:unnamed protein product [Protopolystoma xenopodis]